MEFSKKIRGMVANARQEPEDKLEEYSGKGNTVPFAGKVMPNRGIMHSAALDQFVEPIDGDIPQCNTVYANDIFRSTEQLFAKDDMEILHIIPKVIAGKETCVKAYILKDKDDKIHLHINPGFKETNESYGFRVDSSLDEKEVGDKLSSEDTIMRPHAFDKNGIYKGGINANTIYMTAWETVEDAFLASESFMKKAANYKVFHYKDEFDLDNAVIKNLYGDMNNYKPFPMIGEKIQDNPDNKYANTAGFLLSYSTNASNETFLRSNENLMKISQDDTFKKYPDGSVIVDITVRQARGQECKSEFLKGLIDDNREFELEIYDLLNEYKDEGYEFSIDTEDQYLKYQYIYERIAPNDEPYTFRRGKHGYVPSNKILIDIKMVKINIPFTGQKFTGQHGNKGVCSVVVPDKDGDLRDMKCAGVFKDGTIKTEDGRNVDFVMSTAGVISRANPGQLDVRTINQMSYKVVKHLKDNDDEYSVADKLDIIMMFVKIFSDKQVEAYEELVEEFGPEHFLDYIYEEGILWNLKPFSHGITANTYFIATEFMDEVGIDYGDFGKDWVLVDGEKRFKAENASMYIYLLKQDALKNMSIRTRGAYNQKDSPTKTESKKKHTEKYSSTPIKQSSDDMFLLMGMLEPETVKGIFSTSDSSIVETLEAHLSIMGVELSKD